jgi:hypothetical protein
MTSGRNLTSSTLSAEKDAQKQRDKALLMKKIADRKSLENAPFDP